jgi:hypothetical protein
MGLTGVLVLGLVAALGSPVRTGPTPENPELIAATIFPSTADDGQGFLNQVLRELARRVLDYTGVREETRCARPF